MLCNSSNIKIVKIPIHNELNSNNHQILKIENKGKHIESKGKQIDNKGCYAINTCHSLCKRCKQKLGAIFILKT
jgi:hypothetical protein